jgi:hypothetical protein
MSLTAAIDSEAGKYAHLRFHALADDGSAACDKHNIVPGGHVDAAKVAISDRCKRPACRRLWSSFDIACNT